MDPREKEETKAPKEPELGEHLKPTLDHLMDEANSK